MLDTLPDERVGCHKTGFTKKCRDMVLNEHCQLWVRITGKNPQSKEVFDKWRCAEAWMPILTVENSQQQWGVRRELNILRNETAARGDALLGLAQSARAPTISMPHQAATAPRLLESIDALLLPGPE